MTAALDSILASRENVFYWLRRANEHPQHYAILNRMTKTGVQRNGRQSLFRAVKSSSAEIETKGAKCCWLVRETCKEMLWLLRTLQHPTHCPQGRRCVYVELIDSQCCTHQEWHVIFLMQSWLTWSHNIFTLMTFHFVNIARNSMGCYAEKQPCIAAIK